MDYRTSFAISAAGMAVERARVDVVAINLANANSINPPNGTGFQPLRVSIQTRPAASMLESSFVSTVNNELSIQKLQPLPVAFIEPSGAAPRMVYEPSHPLANQQGYVSFAGVDPAKEMVTLMSATRAYEANVAAMNASRTLALRALDIGSSNT
jgi:flagellar basal-body rod protein FlgC